MRDQTGTGAPRPIASRPQCAASRPNLSPAPQAVPILPASVSRGHSGSSWETAGDGRASDRRRRYSATSEGCRSPEAVVRHPEGRSRRSKTDARRLAGRSSEMRAHPRHAQRSGRVASQSNMQKSETVPLRALVAPRSDGTAGTKLRLRLCRTGRQFRLVMHHGRTGMLGAGRTRSALSRRRRCRP